LDWRTPEEMPTLAMSRVLEPEREDALAAKRPKARDVMLRQEFSWGWVRAEEKRRQDWPMVVGTRMT
jgi:hypothetical protein